ncbi:MAG: hypothetical protein A2945_05375 [Candidatus Liptonbacteria bacterium RIFCSPLOWO2_01_FULL_52_25]|uniref:Uncharacterized protein n=1 Tax=Candidatus Liptonbacteria bacterium RIFCSPLOWO2_01_FULL_52_25 TaxID=1798650 RepID=A0A1G2CFC0_9BACT|nr:MAG: hypothetical protein A2945_05375 [Candidatus Liptonbacteria bacterium RIFCSPLOWO2_01_FULL_52_25]
MKKKSKKTFFTVLVVVVVGFSMLGVGGSFSQIWGGPSYEGKTVREIAMDCTLDMYTKFHIHPNLAIIVNGEPQTLPANIGVRYGCMNPLHAHDETGKIHVESPVQRDFTLGDFFAVWEKTFSKEQIFEHKTDAEHEIVMTVNGSPSDAYENLIFEDEQKIVIEYRIRQ